ncbi:unnamed protein product [Mytilus coruscus]|uniref:C2H2-type domain-containing protein n=1 Tax=Mytilus coruscus TaxID=42192 RepID=A0A6J8C0Q4_MYTCO|nr:unnamed protein product [Mytilus coruscus]
MVCHIHRHNSDVECSPSYHDFVSKEEIHIVLTESGIIPTVENCGVLTKTYEVCEGHFQHLLSLNLKRSRRRLCLLPSFISSHPDIDHSIDQDIHAKSKRKRVDRTLSIDHIRVIQDKYGIVLAVNTRDSTMFKILSECTAAMRKSLEGLDYYLAEGVRAFRELEDVLAELHKMGSISLSDNTFKQHKDLLLECKRYLKVDYKAKEKILNWKCHIIRSRNQGAAKSDLLDSLEESEVVIVLDWAMKYLPRRYREDQSNWYAKRGISWHIGVAFRRTEGNLESLTFVHIFHSQISQDSVTTTSVILDIVEDLNTKYEDISKVHLWSDNAGCYKCTDTINAIAMSGKIVAYNFCEAQDGKGACDRTAATLKAGIRRYINQGNDVTSASQMKKAIESTVKNVKYFVKVVDSKTAVKEKSCLINIPAISSLNNFLFLDEGIKVWRHFSIGEGKLLPKPQNYSVNLPQLNIINACSIDVDFHTLGRPNPKVETTVDPVLSGIFTCETDGCVQSFNTYKELEEHHLVDKCVIIAEKHPKFQKVQLYVDKLNTAQITQRDVELAPANVIEGQNRQAMGWALKATRLNKRFSEKQKNYLIAKFNIGLQTGNKEDPDNVAEEMKYATQNGSRMFASTEFLTPLQISSFFSRHARKTDALRETLITEVENSLTSI